MIKRKKNMERLYAPWREKYVTGMTGKSSTKNKTPKECVFCKQILSKDDQEHRVVKRFASCIIMMNAYPYNVGHLLILPNEHKANLDELSSAVRAEMMEALNIAISIMGKIMNAEGFNIGINLGVAGGGGIPSHLHIHVLPRWRGDTNFLEAIGATKLISSDINNVYKQLKQGFTKVSLTKKR